MAPARLEEKTLNRSLPLFPGKTFSRTGLILATVFLLTAWAVAFDPAAQAGGPLRVAPGNPRYFTDNTGKAIYLTGSHTWSNFQDYGTGYPPPAFDYETYLDFLSANNHNFFRLWSWEQAKWFIAWSEDVWVNPMPFERTGPGRALDGKARFDLKSFNENYFKRMRQRIIKARQRGIYVSIMFFNGFSVDTKGDASAMSHSPWKGNPFNRDNNINGIDGDPNHSGSGTEIHTLLIPDVTKIQKAYVRKVIDTVNDLDNVLYEICNECNSDSTDWQYYMTSYIKKYEAKKPKQHPVGMTSEWPGGKNAELLSSPADWISPNNDSGDYLDNPKRADGKKVILSDTDHLCGTCADRSWVWKSFLRGLNPILMDPYNTPGPGYDPNDPSWVSVRENLGYARTYAEKMNLAKALPKSNLSSTGYCLATLNKGLYQYLVYLPSGGKATVNLTAAVGNLSVEWLKPGTGKTLAGKPTTGGANRSFIAPFPGDAILYIHSD